MSMITENVAQIRSRIAAAARAAGRDPADIRLCAATKMNDSAAVREAIAAGVDCCGENRVQELVKKLDEHAYDGAPVHFIGALQRNKVRQVVGQVDVIESVDRRELLADINAEAAKRGIVQDILLEINAGGEKQKSGFLLKEFPQIVEEMADYPAVRVRGLMTVPPIGRKKGDNCRYFQKIRRIAVDITAQKYDGNDGRFRGRHCLRQHHGAHRHGHFRAAELCAGKERLTIISKQYWRTNPWDLWTN